MVETIAAWQPTSWIEGYWEFGVLHPVPTKLDSLCGCEGENR